MVKRELKSMTKQLMTYNNRDTGKKLDVALFDIHIEGLAAQINRQSDLLLAAKAEQLRTEKELKQMVANISHDIRTPLTSIFGYIQLLEADDLTAEEKQEYVAIIKNRTKRLQALLNDFFELSVIESIDYALQLGHLKMNNLLPEIILGLYDQFNERLLVPDIHIPQDEIIVIADESAVRRVIENLLLNTIKHATGKVSITFLKQQSTAVLMITNKANPLPDNDPSVLFNRFFTVDQTRSGTGAGAGTGLGLSIAKGLMGKMEGKLTAEMTGDHLTMRCEWMLSPRKS
ncbi:sensor histidine kinase [Paenibacillus baekrokdamisoli]|nr:HAMP domain-containing sensor histidine kinase [Paenibacillus baekrokdamisoli]